MVMKVYKMRPVARRDLPQRQPDYAGFELCELYTSRPKWLREAQLTLCLAKEVRSVDVNSQVE